MCDVEMAHSHISAISLNFHTTSRLAGRQLVVVVCFFFLFEKAVFIVVKMMACPDPTDRLQLWL